MDEIKSVVVNLNDSCEVILNQRGADRLNKESIDFKRRFPNVESFQNPRLYHEGDVYRCQMHTLFSVFGDMIHLGGLPPFSTDIEVKRG